MVQLVQVYTLYMMLLTSNVSVVVLIISFIMRADVLLVLHPQMEIVIYARMEHTNILEINLVTEHALPDIMQTKLVDSVNSVIAVARNAMVGIQKTAHNACLLQISNIFYFQRYVWLNAH